MKELTNAKTRRFKNMDNSLLDGYGTKKWR